MDLEGIRGRVNRIKVHHAKDSQRTNNKFRWFFFFQIEIDHTKYFLKYPSVYRRPL